MKKTQPTFQPSSSLRRIYAHDAEYPHVLQQYLGAQAPESIAACGNLDILSYKMLALVCSVKCPGNLILQTYDLARALRDAGITIISGFHSPMEQECLRLLLRGAQPVVVCLARSLQQLRMPVEWQQPIVDGRLLLLSPFDEKQRRATADLAHKRNRFVAALADEVLIAYAQQGGRTEALACEVSQWNKPTYTLRDERNVLLMQYGAQPVDAGAWRTKG